MIRWITVCLAVSIVAASGWSMDLLSNTAISGRAQDVVISGDYAYCADQYGLWALNISDPQAPATVGHWGSPGWSEALVAYQNFVYLCDGENGLAILDVTDPGAPTYIGQALATEGAVQTRLSGNHLCVATGSEGLAVLDLTDPANPAKIGEYAVPAWSSCLATGQNLVALGSIDSLRLLDVTDPANPTLLSAIYVPGNIQRLLTDASASLLIVLRIEQGVSIYDVSNAASPALLSTFATGGWSTSMALMGDTLIVADWFDGIGFHNISDPVRPEQIGGFLPNAFAESMALQGGLLTLAGGDQGLEIWDISDMANPVYQGADDPQGSPQDALFADGFIYEAAGDAGLRVWDENLSTAEPLAQAQTPGWANAIALSANWIYLSDGFGGLRIFDRSSSPAEAFAVPLPEYAGVMGINAGNDLFVAQGSSGFAALHMEGLSAPQLLSTTPTQGYVYDLAVAGNLLVTCEGPDGSEIFDISDPANPQLSAAVASETGAWCAALGPGRVYISTGAQGVGVYDISNPPSPNLLGTTGSLGWVQSLSFDGNETLIASSGRDGIFALSMAQTPPVITDQFDTFGSARRCAFGPGGVVCADEMDLSLLGGLAGVADAKTAPLSYEILSAYPNPFNPTTRIAFTLPSAGQANLSIYDLTGRLVAQLLSGRLAAGAHEAAWQPDANIASGAYFIRLHTDQQTQIQRVLFVK